jgi:hypothetical protein
MEKRIDQMSKGLRLEKPRGWTGNEYLWGLIERCWDNDFSKRPTFEEIVKELMDNKDGFGIPNVNLKELEDYKVRVTTPPPPG